MSTYAIGDLQGCYTELQELLDTINFDHARDRLWFTGDLVNRGPDSLACLRFVVEHEFCATTVLGNHDLHLLAVALGIRPAGRKDTFEKILASPDSNELLHWMRHRPLMVRDQETGFCMLHAGLFPSWSIALALDLAAEVEDTLRGDRHQDFMKVMYGNEPEHWSESLRDFDRQRCVVNCFTRMRYLDEKGHMNYSEKGPPGSQSKHLIPWYRYPDRKSAKQKIVFGHWSTVYLGDDRNFTDYNVYPLDTGCLWGGKLSALRLEDETWFSVPSRQPATMK